MHSSSEEQAEDSLLVIAVDFGTAFSGYCFQFRGGDQIRNPKWGLEFGYDTPKTPTCILFDEEGNFLEFGYSAVMTYTRLARKNEAQKLLFFNNFKMELYGKTLNRDLEITAKNGKTMRAMKVFSESLRYMKDHALKMIEDHAAEVKFSASEAVWVLTVPAIWSSAAKQFMREAAVEAGLVTPFDPENLIVALEPEAASVCCKQLPSEGFLEQSLQEAEKIEDIPETRYMVVDCGGGTIDITVHEVVAEGRLKELHKVSGNNMGGQRVDENFRLFLREIFSDVFDEFEENHPRDLQKLMFDFSFCKRFDRNVLVSCPNSLERIAGKDMEDYFEGISDAEWDDGSILLTGEKMRSLHDDSLRAIENQIRDILEKPNMKISYIFLVGGFSLSPHVREFVREKFGSQCKVLCPIDAQLAIVKGAVQFGFMPNVVESRISLYTYGVLTCARFNEFKHRGKSKRVSENGVVFCDVCFHCLVRKDESVHVDEVRQHTFNPIERDQREALFDFYCTDRESAKFTDEPGMEKIGSFSVSMPLIKKGRGRSIRLEVRFGSTEIKATATDVESGQTSSVTLDFMTK